MSQSKNSPSRFDSVLTTLKNRAADRKTRVTTLVAVTVVATSVAAYKYRNEISSWSCAQVKRVCNWWKGSDPDH